MPTIARPKTEPIIHVGDPNDIVIKVYNKTNVLLTNQKQMKHFQELVKNVKSMVSVVYHVNNQFIKTWKDIKFYIHVYVLKEKLINFTILFC